MQQCSCLQIFLEQRVSLDRVTSKSTEYQPLDAPEATSTQYCFEDFDSKY